MGDLQVVGQSYSLDNLHALIKRGWLNRYVIRNTKHVQDLVFEYMRRDAIGVKKLNSYSSHRIVSGG
ncbi:hypothetical protein [Candidatus Desulfosporosinus nitrosoreducens]|uniref:hypothetical protein n=1 Tax=Candidatus Desulfosporosinus nitrosoreducens TaxID=3401928 RepID=UPI00280AF0EA|nr:hypothetical protein [Desulfosporosinus sp. PR]